jgi:hypothetical protein
MREALVFEEAGEEKRGLIVALVAGDELRVDPFFDDVGHDANQFGGAQGRHLGHEQEGVAGDETVTVQMGDGHHVDGLGLPGEAVQGFVCGYGLAEETSVWHGGVSCGWRWARRRAARHSAGVAGPWPWPV